MSLDISEVCLVANLQTQGPMYISDSGKKIFDPTAGMLLAARIIITAGMGNSASPRKTLHGPVPIPELNLDENYECYFFINEMQQKPLPAPSYSTGKGSYIICIVIKASDKKNFRPYEARIEEILNEKSEIIDFSDSITGELTESIQLKTNENLIDIFSDINAFLKLAPLYEGTSLFDVGFIASLPENISIIAKKLILHPKGIEENDIENKKILKTLYQAGLISKDLRNGVTWIIPK